MQKRFNCFWVVVLLLALFFNLFSTKVVFAEYLDSDDSYLRKAGMPSEEILAMDDEVKAFIVSDLKNSSSKANFKYTDIKNMLRGGIQTLSGVSYSASAFKSGNIIYIYPTYEFTSDKKPDGRDIFALTFGNAYTPYEYGGKLWYKDYSMNSWASDSDLVMEANHQGVQGCAYSGTQLGAPDYSMKFRGCASIHAHVGDGTDKRLTMQYYYNPSSLPFQISISVGAVSVSFSGNSTTYTSSSTKILSY